MRAAHRRVPRGFVFRTIAGGVLQIPAGFGLACLNRAACSFVESVRLMDFAILPPLVTRGARLNKPRNFAPLWPIRPLFGAKSHWGAASAQRRACRNDRHSAGTGC